MKSMKKSMFVTTILMVVLLIVALSTATFAWYTAQSSAAVTKTQVVSASSTTASLVIDTAQAGLNANNSSVDLQMSTDNVGGAINPLIIDGAAPTTDTVYDTFKGKFATFTVNNSLQYTASPTLNQNAAIIWKAKGSGSLQTQDSFFVTNVGGVPAWIHPTVTIYEEYYTVVAGVEAETTTVTGYYTKSGDSYTQIVAENTKAVADTVYYEAKTTNPYLRVAMFINDHYVGTWAMSGNTSVKYYDYTSEGAIAAGTALKSHGSYVATTSGSAIDNAAANVASGAAVEINLVAWFEGDSMQNSNAGSGASFSISFASTSSARS